MTRFILEITCDNEAFQPSPEAEIGRIMSRLSEHVAAFGASSGPVRDINGNTVGSYRLEES